MSLGVGVYELFEADRAGAVVPLVDAHAVDLARVVPSTNKIVPLPIVGAIDGTSVVGQNGHRGVIVSAPFSCDICANAASDSGATKMHTRCCCVEVFIPNSKRILRHDFLCPRPNMLATTSTWKVVEPSALANGRAALLAHAQRTASISSTCLYLLGVAYHDRPLLAFFNETDLGIGVRGRSPKMRWYTGADILAAVWPILGVLKTLNIPSSDGASRVRGMIVTYGTQKGPDFTYIYLASIIGNYNMLPLLNYMDPYSVVKLLKKQQIDRAVIFAPKQYCSLFERIVPADVTIVALRPSRTSEHANVDSRFDTKFAALSELIEQLPLSLRSLPSADFLGATGQRLGTKTSSAVLLVPRSNSLGDTEVVVTPFLTNFERVVNQLKGSVSKADEGTKALVNVSPVSSGDMLSLLESFAVGDRHAMLCGSLAHLPYASELASPYILVSTPVQYRPLVESFLLHSHVMGRSEAERWWGSTFGPRLLYCGSGGGTPEPKQQLWLKHVVCKPPANVIESWGSYEMLDITYTLDDRQHFHSQVKAWAMRDVGPYSLADGRGELLLQTAHMHKHDDPAFNSRHFVMVQGRESEGYFFCTKDVVQMTTPRSTYGTLRAGVKMIDKVNGPFKLSIGKYVATGMLERAIEDDQRLVYNCVVFGSERVDGVVAVVWPTQAQSTNSQGDDKLADRLLMQIQQKLQQTAAVKPWEIPTAVVVSNECWEYRPRHKIRWMLTKKFQAAVQAALPGAIWPPVFGAPLDKGSLGTARPVDLWPPSAIDGVDQTRGHLSAANVAAIRQHIPGEYGDRTIPGARRMIVKKPHSNGFYIWGHDGVEPDRPWEASGELTPEGNLLADFSAKGGPKQLMGQWVGNGICWADESDQHVGSNCSGGKEWPKFMATTGASLSLVASHSNGLESTVFARWTSVNLAVIHNIYQSNQLRAAADGGRGLHCHHECREYSPEFALLCKLDGVVHTDTEQDYRNSFSCAKGVQRGPAQRHDVAEVFVLDAIMACNAVRRDNNAVTPAGLDTGCMLRSANGILREPSLRPTVYRIESSISERRNRFDAIPWHLWDLPRTVNFHGQHTTLSASDIADGIEQLYRRKDDIAASIPLYLPSLGLLHEFGSRFRDRLTNAYRLSIVAPHVLQANQTTSELEKEIYSTLYGWQA
eukprot:SAG31_NODE_1756_length_7343_cov_2.790309_5_plen_1157_part_00